MPLSLSIHGTKTIKAEAGVSANGEGAWLDLIIKSDDGDIEITLYFDSVALAQAYADAIGAARVMRVREAA